MSWRSATAYDAVMVVVSVLKANPKLDRIALQKALSADTFKAEGATGQISFEGSNRKEQEQFPVLLRVLPNPQQNGDRYLFTSLCRTPAGGAKDCKGK